MYRTWPSTLHYPYLRPHEEEENFPTNIKISDHSGRSLQREASFNTLEERSDPFYGKFGYGKPLESDGEGDAYDRLTKVSTETFHLMVELGQSEIRPRHSAREWFEERRFNSSIPET